LGEDLLNENTEVIYTNWLASIQPINDKKRKGQKEKKREKRKGTGEKKRNGRKEKERSRTN
jgi:hypothetical protein